MGLHSSASQRNNVAKLPAVIVSLLGLNDKRIDKTGLAGQILALYLWSYLLVEIKLVTLEDWREISVQVLVAILFGILIITNWGWWRKQ